MLVTIRLEGFTRERFLKKPALVRQNKAVSISDRVRNQTMLQEVKSCTKVIKLDLVRIRQKYI